MRARDLEGCLRSGSKTRCAVVSTTEVKVLVVKASAYLHQLLNRHWCGGDKDLHSFTVVTIEF